MKITTKWLKKEGACSEGVVWLSEQKCGSDRSVIEKLMAEEKYEWANWAFAFAVSFIVVMSIKMSIKALECIGRKLELFIRKIFGG